MATRRVQVPQNYAQILADPLRIPYGAEQMWVGRRAPNLATLAGRGSHRNITPIRTPQGWAAYGVPTNPMPPWVQSQLDWFTNRGRREQNWAQQHLAPQLAAQLGALQNIQAQAQTGFANMVGQTSAQLANAAGQVGPGAAHAGAAMAPFQSAEGLANELAAGQAGSQTGAAAYQAAVDQLEGNTLAQGLQAGLAQEIARIPDRWDQQRQQFMAQITPVLMQLEADRERAEFQRRLSLEDRRRWGIEFREGRRQFNRQIAVEQALAGMQDQLTREQMQQQQQQWEAEFGLEQEQARARQQGPQMTPAQKAAQKRHQQALDVLRRNRGQRTEQGNRISAADIANAAVRESGVDWDWAWRTAIRMGYHHRRGERTPTRPGAAGRRAVARGQGNVGGP